MDNLAEVLDRLTANARASVVKADMWSQMLSSEQVGTDHLLLGIIAQTESTGAKILSQIGVNLRTVEQELGIRQRTDTNYTPAIKMMSVTARMSFEIAGEVASDFGSPQIGTEHLLFSLLTQRNAQAVDILDRFGVDIDQIRQIIEAYLNQSMKRVGQSSQRQMGWHQVRRQRNQSLLNVFGVNLTERARNNKLDPIIGREEEIERLGTILSRKAKSNPLVIGEPGVGKTAIVEGLAQRIAALDVPTNLVNAEIIQLDLAAMVAGTKYRGEFEQRLKKVIDEASKQPNLILFIDEFHLITGAGASEGSLDAANILKPSLARGEIRLIGATTFDEYKRSIEKDSALDRRLQLVEVKEPTRRQTIQIIKGLRETYQDHHRVSFDDEVINQATNMAERYLPERFMPDKAIDLIDEAAALKRIRTDRLSAKAKQQILNLRKLEEEFSTAMASDELEKIKQAETKLSQAEGKLDQLKASLAKKRRITLNSADIAKLVAIKTGIPVAKLNRTEQRALLNLERNLAKRVIGQKQAIRQISQAIWRSRAGIASSQRPIGSFVFLGSSGVGKTELARVLAEEVFGSRDSLIKLDMSEFSERHTLSQLLGAPAGYVGYDDGGQLTDKVRRQPYRVILFDEIEKAHSEIYNILLQLLEDGVLTDAKGRQVNFSNTIVILTSNVGCEELVNDLSKGEFGFKLTGPTDKIKAKDQQSAKLEAALKKLMRPELINRFDDIIVFNQLSSANLTKICDLLIDDLNQRLLRRKIQVKLTPAAKRHLLAKIDAKDGARPLRRLIEEKIETPLAERLIREEVVEGDLVNVGVKQGKLNFEQTIEKVRG